MSYARIVFRKSVRDIARKRTNAFVFTATGRAKWLKAQLWKFLRYSGCLTNHVEQHELVSYIDVDAASIAESILKQRRELANVYNRQATKILIGRDEFHEIARQTVDYPVSFQANIRLGNGGRPPELFGLQIEVIPWMKGVIVY